MNTYIVFFSSDLIGIIYSEVYVHINVIILLVGYEIVMGLQMEISSS